MYTEPDQLQQPRPSGERVAQARLHIVKDDTFQCWLKHIRDTQFIEESNSAILSQISMNNVSFSTPKSQNRVHFIIMQPILLRHSATPIVLLIQMMHNTPRHLCRYLNYRLPLCMYTTSIVSRLPAKIAVKMFMQCIAECRLTLHVRFDSRFLDITQ